MNTTTYDQLEQDLTLSLGGRIRQSAQEIVRGFRTHAALYTLAFGIYAIGLIQSLWLGVPLSFGLVSIVSGSTFVFLFLIIFLWLAGDFARLWWTGYQGSPATALKTRLLDDILAPGRVSNTLHAFTANGVFFVGFMTVKKNIPIAVPFGGWDRTFMELDRTLHFGLLPHEILAPLFQYPLVTFLVNVNYNLWFVVLMTFLFWQGFRKTDTVLRQRYLVAYLMTWGVGTCVLGTVLSSAGPCFYGLIESGANPYAGLMNYLAGANDIYPIWAVPTQATLWDSHLAGHGDIEGVSAMPSMHVGTTILFICCAVAAGKRWLVWFSSLFALSIFLGSILLGWHYAIDGYLGALVALACWKLSGWWVGRMTELNSRPSSAPR